MKTDQVSHERSLKKLYILNTVRVALCLKYKRTDAFLKLSQVPEGGEPFASLHLWLSMSEGYGSMAWRGFMVNFKPNKTMQQRQSAHYKYFKRGKKSGEGKRNKERTNETKRWLVVREIKI